MNESTNKDNVKMRCTFVPTTQHYFCEKQRDVINRHFKLQHLFLPASDQYKTKNAYVHHKPDFREF